MEKILLFLLLTAVGMAQSVPVTATWNPNEDVQSYHIFIWEGLNEADSPLFEDSSYTYLTGLGLIHFITLHPDSQMVFNVDADGGFVQVAGFNEYAGEEFLTGASVSGIKQKPLIVIQEKMSGLRIDLEMPIPAFTDTLGFIPKANGSFWLIDEGIIVNGIQYTGSANVQLGDTVMKARTYQVNRAWLKRDGGDTLWVEIK